MSTRYPYVGPERIRVAALEQPEGTPMRSHDDLERWARDRATGELRAPFTYVVEVEGWLRLAPRESEHVACAGGREVLGAGELVLARDGGRWCVAEITNQSTGYCPDPTSWTAIAAALDRAGIARPPRFTVAFAFRWCACGALTVIKDDDYTCAACAAALHR
ncbi:MAG: hypothetical protein J0L92_24665 [Deltaproteobacteria bacterium]|nr:hypothetical protein [Deltaproteobacteria bacterium]